MNRIKQVMRGLIERYNAMPTPVRASLWFVICNLIQTGINVISVPIFTRMMSTEEYGTYNTFFAWRNILIIFTSLNLSYGVFNNAMVRYEDSKTRDQYVSSMQGLYGIITCAFFAVYWLNRDWCNGILKMSTPVVVLLFVELLFYPALLFWSGRQRYEFKYRWLVVITLAMSVASVGVGVLAVHFSTHKDIARIASWVGVDAVFCGGFFIYHFVKGRKFCVPKFWKYALGFNIPLVPHYLSETVLGQADRIMIDKYVSATATANYSTAYSVATMLQLFLNAINASFLPWSYACLKNKRYQDIRRMCNILLVLISGLVLLMMLFAPELIYIFAGEKYADAIFVIPPVAASVFFMLLYDFFSTVEFYYGQNIFVMIASVISAGLNIFLNWLMIPRFGYYAAGYTTLFCYMLYALGHYFFYRIVSRKHMEGNRVFDERWILFMSLLVVAVTVLINIIYANMWIRYGIALVVFALFVWKRRQILGYFKTMKEQKEETAE